VYINKKGYHIIWEVENGGLISTLMISLMRMAMSETGEGESG
jgi:hypothetical protein